MKRRNFGALALAAAAAFTLSACGGTPESNLPSISQVVADSPQLSTLSAAIDAAGLSGTLNGDGPFTLFAPSNAAFAALPEGTLDSLLLPENQDQLTAILTYHVVPQMTSAGGLVANGPGSLTTVNGADVAVTTDGVVRVGGAAVTQPDILTDNGVIHLIDGVLLPPQ
jgi:uncharacterized surface protein with fasciclin (FAS1) repeats